MGRSRDALEKADAADGSSGVPIDYRHTELSVGRLGYEKRGDAQRLSTEHDSLVSEGVRRVIREYGNVLKKLSSE